VSENKKQSTGKKKKTRKKRNLKKKKYAYIRKKKGIESKKKNVFCLFLKSTSGLKNQVKQETTNINPKIKGGYNVGKIRRNITATPPCNLTKKKGKKQVETGKK